MPKKQMLPSGQAGLVRYYDVEEGIQLKPETVIWISIAFTALVIILKFLA